MNRAFRNMTMAPVLVLLGPTSFGRSHKLTLVFKISVAERSVYRDDFSFSNMSNHARLCNGITRDRYIHIDVHHFARTRVAEILRGGPDDISPRCAFKCRNCRA